MRRQRRIGQFGLIQANTALLERPVLCVIVDVEEEFDWSGPFSRRNTFVNSIHGLRRGHDIFRRYGLQPTYLLDYPVVADPHAREFLGTRAESAEAVIGAQLHPWVTPPFEEVVCPYNSFPCNLEENLERRKLATLTQAINEALGVTPQVYKAGRYGFDLGREHILRDLGYVVDTSIMPFRDYSGMGGGPDSFAFPDQPFWTEPEHRVLYLPVTHSVIGPLRGLSRSWFGRLVFGTSASRMHIPGALARLGLFERIMLTPEGLNLEALQRLTRSLLAASYRVLILSLHSSSFVKGGTPYARSDEDIEAMLSRIERFLEFFFRSVGGASMNPLELKLALDARSVQGNCSPWGSTR